MKVKTNSTTQTIQVQPTEMLVRTPAQKPSLKVKTHVKAGTSAMFSHDRIALSSIRAGALIGDAIIRESSGAVSAGRQAFSA